MRGARAPGIDGREIPVDWLVETHVGGTEEDLQKALANEGLSRNDVRQCKYCNRLMVTGSRKTEVCKRQECRRMQARENRQRSRQAEKALAGRRP
jgi:hypothetical protein